MGTYRQLTAKIGSRLPAGFLSLASGSSPRRRPIDLRATPLSALPHRHHVLEQLRQLAYLSRTNGSLGFGTVREQLERQTEVGLDDLYASVGFALLPRAPASADDVTE